MITHHFTGTIFFHLTGNNGETTITQPPSDTRASDSGTAEFKCVASVPQNREVEFEMFGKTVRTDDSTCTTVMPSLTKRTCDKQITRNISTHSMTLSCDYSTGYQINCSLKVDKLKDKDSSNVTCRILYGSTIEATRTAKLLAGMNTQHSLSCSPPCITLSIKTRVLCSPGIP